MNAIKRILLAVLLLTGPALFSQTKKDSLGLPGDNFDLYGALELFKKSGSPEAFEKAINSDDNEVNNLDLDADGKVDYIKVVDKTKDDVHSLVMQVEVSKTEVQDVAVIEIEKQADGKAHMQIVGDEELYGKDYIIEPRQVTATGTTNEKSGVATNEDDVYTTGSNAVENNSTVDNSTNNYNSNPQVVVNVWAWPAVQYMYTPAYVGWSSPWYWGYYPGWWQPWPPIYWGVYYRRVYHYHYPYYQRAYQYNCRVAHNYYYGYRSSSPMVRDHNHSGLYHQRQAEYRNNPVRGQRYNALPANPEKRVGPRQATGQNAMRQGGENKQSVGQQPGRSNPQASPQQGRRTVQPEQQNGKRATQATPQQRQQAVPQQASPQRNTVQPRQVNPQPKQNVQPRQANPQPRQNVQPQQPGRSQPSPEHRSGGARQSSPVMGRHR